MFYSKKHIQLSTAQLALSAPLAEGANPHFRRFKAAATEDSWLSGLLVLTFEAIHNPVLSVRWLANEMHLSERQFSRRVRQKTALSPQQIVMGAKLHTAYYLLGSPAFKTVKQVAAALHFSDVKYFSRTFSKCYNIYPSDLLKRSNT